MRKGSLLLPCNGTCCNAQSSSPDSHGEVHQVVQRSDPNHKTIQVVEERAVITKHRKLTGGVRVRTVVHEDEITFDEPLGIEQVEMARVPLDRWVEAPIPVRQEGDTTILTLHEEVTVVEKRLRAVEEVHLTRERSTRNAPKHIALRREEAVIEHLEVAADEEDAA